MESSDPTHLAGVTWIRPDSVKIDGIRTVEHALVAADAGVELIGMIFAPTRRQVPLDTARRISDTVHGAASVFVVGVFVDATADDINASTAAAGLDLVQLHGDEPPELLARLDLPAIKAFRALPAEGAEALATRIRRFLEADVRPVAVLIDGYHPTEHGGTGVQANWGMVRDVSRFLGQRVGLAGGLSPDNVEGAITAVRPLLVDISSGVEVDGVKDAGLIRSFIERADAAFHRSRIESGIA